MSIIKGLGQAKSGLRSQGKKLMTFTKTQVEIVGRNVVLEARKDGVVPKDLGGLGQSILYEPIDNGFGAKISANVLYAPYQEFGTGGKVDIPKGFEELAKPFHVGNGKMSMKAQPYLIPSAKNGFKDLVRRLSKEFRK
jgi:hypothetical protein